MSEMSIHLCSSRSLAAAPPLEDENLLFEILLRLPPEPSSLPRASAVCKRWRHLVSDARFTRRFRLHHRHNPPLLGFFHHFYRIAFEPTLEAPNRVPPKRFSLHQTRRDGLLPLGSRHGLVLMLDPKRKQLLVWDPVTGGQNRIALPPRFNVEEPQNSGAVLRASGDGDVHFQVVWVMATSEADLHTRVLGCVYSSETGLWSDLVSTLRANIEVFDGFFADGMRAVLVGDSLYWTLVGQSPGILEFDLERRSLAVIPLPMDVFGNDFQLTVIRAEGGGLGLLFVSNLSAQLWKRTDCDVVGSWKLGRTIQLDKLLSLNSVEERTVMIGGFAECSNVVFLWTGTRRFMLHLESLQVKQVLQANSSGWCQPFECVYAAGV